MTVHRPDVVICTSPPLTVGLTGAAMRAFHRRPMVFEVRDLWPETAIETGVLTSLPLIRLSYWLERLSYRSASWINVLTPAFRDALIHRKSVRPDRVSVITNAADLDTFRPAPKDNWVREKFGLRNKFIVMYVGAHGVANHLVQILEAARLLDEWTQIHFMLVGDGMQKAMLRRRAEEWGLSNVTLVDAVPKREIVDYVAAADLCTAVLRNLDVFKTVYPNKVFDYMSAARPILLGIDGVARELVEEANAGVFVPPEDPVAFAQAVRQLAADPRRCEQMGRAGLEFVTSRYAREHLADRFLDILRTRVVPAECVGERAVQVD
jgi:glycosyltransferase involved in cell wall biosynthesis